jgi:aspartyl-tRNA(Asn)/glutamyl-tRNA(Gln) amidotransferase subunit C
MIDTKTVDKIAALAKLEFNLSEKEAMVNDLNKIIAFMDKLNELDTENVSPMIYMTNETNALRSDVVQQDISQKEALLNAPKKDSDYIKVPKVIGG